MTPARVLVVDRSPTIRKVVRSVLATHGLETLEAADGEVALERLADRHHPIDVMLVDLETRIGGEDLCRVVRTKAIYARLSIVLMSARANPMTGDFVRAAGATLALAKPFDPEMLLTAVKNATRGATEATADAWCALAGDLAAISIGAVLQMLQREAQSGVLVVTSGSREIAVALRDGCIDPAQSTSADLPVDEALRWREGRFEFHPRAC